VVEYEGNSLPEPGRRVKELPARERGETRGNGVQLDARIALRDERLDVARVERLSDAAEELDGAVRHAHRSEPPSTRSS
jgi:hypothetical protein